MTTVQDLVDYLETYPRRMPVYLTVDHAPKEPVDYVLLDRAWYSCELADAEDRERTVTVAKMRAALAAALPALVRLGDFVGNVDEGGASGLGRIDRCAIISQVREAIK